MRGRICAGGIVRGDQVALRLAQRWAKVAGVLFAIGAVSGSVLGVEMGLLWPGLMGRFGDLLGLPFFLGVIFLGTYPIVGFFGCPWWPGRWLAWRSSSVGPRRNWAASPGLSDSCCAPAKRQA